MKQREIEKYSIEEGEIEEKVRIIYSSKRFKPIRTIHEMIYRLKEEYKLLVDENVVSLTIAAFLNNRPVLYEGPPGTGKTEIGYAILTLWSGHSAFILPCSENYDEYRVIGDFHPLMAMKYGFNEKSFMPRPLLAALILDAGVLIDEIRRSSEEFQNLLLDIIDKRRIIVPELRRVFTAKGDGFQIIFTSNPEDIAQNELSDAFLRRVIRIKFTYPTPEKEYEIVKLRLSSDMDFLPSEIVSRMIDAVNELRKKAMHKPGIADLVLWSTISVNLAKARGLRRVTTKEVYEAGLHTLCKRIEDELLVEEILSKYLGVT